MQWLLLIIAGLLGGWTHGSGSGSNLPCGIVVCAEAYSVTRQMISTYNGPLFQLSKLGGATLDVGQVGGKADMSTWSAFCSGVAANCFYSKIYAQVHTANNTLGPYLGANQVPFGIEGTTGLPIFIADGNNPYSIPGSGSDIDSVGITGFGAAISIHYVGKFVTTTVMCCGAIGAEHRVGQPDIPGSDFDIMPTYGQGTFSFCSTTTIYCLQVDTESSEDFGDVGPNPIWLIAAGTFDPGTNTIAGLLNTHLIFSHSPPASVVNNGIAIHLAGGGDFSPAPTIMFEALFTNTTISATQHNSLYTNSAAFYSPLSFP